jgi:magnesium chelatase family protein
VDYEKISDSRVGEPSQVIQVRVEKARQVQRERFASTHIFSNADMRPAEIRKYCILDDAGKNLMKSAMTQLQLSARAYHRVLKLARTISDLQGTESISSTYLAEALQYRPRFDLI